MATEAEIDRFVGYGDVRNHIPRIGDIAYETIILYSPNLEVGDYASEIKKIQEGSEFYGQLLLRGDDWSPDLAQTISEARFDYDAASDELYATAPIEIADGWAIKKFTIQLSNVAGSNLWTDLLTWENDQQGEHFTTGYTWRDPD